MNSLNQNLCDSVFHWLGVNNAFKPHNAIFKLSKHGPISTRYVKFNIFQSFKIGAAEIT